MKPRLLLTGVLAALVATMLAAVSPSLLALVDLRIYDAMLQRTPVPSRAAIVAVDDRSLGEIGQWPWPRRIIAQLVDGVRRLGASVVAVDILLAEPDRFDTEADAALAAVVAQGRVVLGYALTFDENATADRCVLHPIMPALVDGPDGRSPVHQLFHATGALCSLPALTVTSASSGYLNASPDRDGLLRRIPLVMEYQGGIYPSLALAAVMKAGGAKPLTLTGLAGDRTRLTIGEVDVPLDARGTLLVRFRGTSAPISATDVLHGRAPADALRDRIVFVGATAIGVQDVVSTPIHVATPGMEVHASAADTLLQGEFLSTPPYGRAYEVTATFVFALAVLAAVSFWGALNGSLAATVLLGLLWWATWFGVNTWGIFLSPVFPTTGVALVLSVLTLAHTRHERLRAEAERARRKRAHQFVVQSLTSLTETRDSATGKHARRTQEYSRLLASRLAAMPRFRDELTPERVELISQLSPLHDIGKVGIPDAVLHKPGALSDEERQEIHKHPGFGYETIVKAERLAGVADEFLLQLAKEIIYTHHERWDGRGYPRGLKGDAIPVAGRIMALVDVYDALSNSRSYRTSVTHDEAVRTIVAGRGTHFDPDVVDAFLALSDEFRQLSVVLRDQPVANVQET